MLLLIFLQSFALQAATPCTSQLRGLFDIGSGTTKLTLALGKVCGRTFSLEKILDEQGTRPVALEASKNAAGEIPAEAIALTVKAVQDLAQIAKTEAARLNPPPKEIVFAAVGTHAFRTAANKLQFAQAIEKLGIPMREVSHADEGKFGYEGVKIKGIPRACKGKTLWVWDIGGGSWELTQKDGNRYEMFGQEKGAEAFKVKLTDRFRDLRKPVPACEIKESTPNPIGRRQIARARTLARLQVRPVLSTAKLDLKNSCVVGIGGVHTKAVEAQVRRNWPQIRSCVCSGKACPSRAGLYRKKDLQCLVDFLSEKTDCDPELQGSYSTTAVSNLLLVLGALEELKVDTVHTVNVNMGHHLLSQPGLIDYRALPQAPSNL